MGGWRYIINKIRSKLLISDTDNHRQSNRQAGRGYLELRCDGAGHVELPGKNPHRVLLQSLLNENK